MFLYSVCAVLYLVCWGAYHIAGEDYSGEDDMLKFAVGIASCMMWPIALMVIGSWFTSLFLQRKLREMVK